MPKFAFFPKLNELPYYIRQKSERIIHAANGEQLVERCREFCAEPLEKPCERNLFCWHHLIEFFESLLEKHVRCVTSVFIHGTRPPLSREQVEEHINFLQDDTNLRELLTLLKTTLFVVRSASLETRFAYTSIKLLSSLLLHPCLEVSVQCLEIMYCVVKSRAKYRLLRFHCDDNRTFLERLSTVAQTWLKRCGVRIFNQEIVGDGNLDELLFPGGDDILELTPFDGNETTDLSLAQVPSKKIHLKRVLNELNFGENEISSLVEFISQNELAVENIFEFIWNIRYCSKIGQDTSNANLFVIGLKASAISVISERILHESKVSAYFSKEPDIFPVLAKVACKEVPMHPIDITCHIQRHCVECFSLFIDRNFYESISSRTIPTLIRRTSHSLIRLDQLLNENLSYSLVCDWEERKLFMESLLQFIERLARHLYHTNLSPLSNAGLFQSMMLLFSSTNIKLSETVAQAARTWHSILEHNNNVMNVFRDSNGLHIIAERIFKEVCELDDSQLDTLEEDNRVEHQVMELMNEEMETQRMYRSTVAFRGFLDFSRFILIHDCLKLFMTAHGTSGGRHTREIASSSFCKCLRRIIARPIYYGGDLFSLAAKAVSQIAHSEPTTTSFIIDVGICDALIESLRRGIPYSNSALRCIPNLISALCLVPTGLAKIQQANVLQLYFKLLTNSHYSQALLEDTAADIGSSFEELVRHVPSLKNEIVGAVWSFLNNSVKLITKKKEKEDVMNSEEYSDSENEYEGGSCAMRVDHHNMSSQGYYGSDHNGDDIKVVTACVAAELFENFAKGNREIQSALVSRNCVSQLLSLRLGFVESRQSRRSSFYFSGLNSVVNALHRLESRHQETVFKQLLKVAKEDVAQFLDSGATLGDVWLTEEWESQSHSLSKERRNIQKRLFVYSRRLCVDLQILTSLAKHSNFPLSCWNSQNTSSFISNIAWAERLARFHLSRAFADVQISVASSDADLCDFSTARITHAAPSLEKPVDIPFVREICKILCYNWDPTSDKHRVKEEYAKLKTSFQPFFYPRDTLKGLAWALATFVAAVQPLYTVLCKKMNRSQRYTIRSSEEQNEISNAANSFAKTLGQALALHLLTARNLFTSKVGTLGQTAKDEKPLNDILTQLAAYWTYLIGILGEIRATLFEGMNARNSLPFSPLIASFVESGGVIALAQVLNLPHLLNDIFAMDSKLYELVEQVKKQVDEWFDGETLEPKDEESLRKKLKRCSTLEEKLAILSKIPHVELQTILYQLLDKDIFDSPLKQHVSENCVAYYKEKLAKSIVLMKRYSTYSISALVVSTVASNLVSGVFQFLHLLITSSGKILSDSVNNANYRMTRPDYDYHDLIRAVYVDLFRVVNMFCHALNERNEAVTDPVGSRLLFDTFMWIVKLFDEIRTQMSIVGKTPEEVSREHISARRSRSRRLQQRISESPLVAQLVEMGFSRRRAMEAVRRANTERLEYAMEVVLSLPEIEDEEESSEQQVSENQEENLDGVDNRSQGTRLDWMEQMMMDNTEQESFIREDWQENRCKQLFSYLSCKIFTEEMDRVRECLFGTKIPREKVESTLNKTAVGYVDEMEAIGNIESEYLSSSIERLKLEWNRFVQHIRSIAFAILKASCGKHSSFVFLMLLRSLGKTENYPTEDDYMKLAKLCSESIEKNASDFNHADLIILKCAALCTHHLGRTMRKCLVEQDVATRTVQFVENMATRIKSVMESLQEMASQDAIYSQVISHILTGLMKDKLRTCLLLLDSILVFGVSDHLMDSKDFIGDYATGSEETPQANRLSFDDATNNNNGIEIAQSKIDALFRSSMENNSASDWHVVEETGMYESMEQKEELLLQQMLSSLMDWQSYGNQYPIQTSSLLDSCISLLSFPWSIGKDYHSAHAIIQLLSTLTENERLVARFHESKGLKVLLSKPLVEMISTDGKDNNSVFISRLSPVLFAFRNLIRNLIQDAEVLENGMVDSIRLILKSRSTVNPSFLFVHAAPLIAKSPTVFLKALAKTCRLKKVGNHSFKLEVVGHHDVANDLCLTEERIPHHLQVVLLQLMTLLDEDNGLHGLYRTIFSVLHDLVDTFPCVARALVILSERKNGLRSWIERFLVPKKSSDNFRDTLEYSVSLLLLSLLDREDEFVSDYLLTILCEIVQSQMEVLCVPLMAAIGRLVCAIQRVKIRCKLVSKGFPGLLVQVLERMADQYGTRFASEMEMIMSCLQLLAESAVSMSEDTRASGEMTSG
eukprot:jgi/Galph1/2179/GphlegSOOS_G828.1